MTKEIQLTQGFVTLIDDGMFDYLSQWKWRCSNGKWNKYVVRTTSRRGGYRKCIRMHRLIVNAREGEQVDHWDRDGLNNQRGNLRVCTNGQNQCNRMLHAVNNTSGFKGVYQKKGRDQWGAQIEINGKHIYLGYFDDPIQAALAYDNGARKYHGQFARTNFLEV